MPQVYFGLGSNLGDRRDNLRRAIELLQSAGLRLQRVSPVVESPALLPEGSPADWNLPFLNLVIEGTVSEPTEHWLHINKSIQDRLGRTNVSRWSPRPMDIDILLWGNEVIATETLTVPHKDLARRAFVLSPLVHLRPDLKPPGGDGRTVIQLARNLRHHIPLWMGIVNVTPDSFSAGHDRSAPESVVAAIRGMLDAGVHLIDIGAESTRPGATPLDWKTEWRRLEPALTHTQRLLGDDLLRPRISIDTRHSEVAHRALERGVDMINDVSGLTDPAMRELAAGSDRDFIAMHHLSIPASANRKLPRACDPVAEVTRWFEAQMSNWERAGIDLDRVILDPGIGFGKDSLHSLELMRHVQAFYGLGLRIVVGHSRKSFMQAFADTPPPGRDLETIGASLKLCEKGVDILRVHDVTGHVRAYTAWAHVEPYT